MKCFRNLYAKYLAVQWKGVLYIPRVINVFIVIEGATRGSRKTTTSHQTKVGTGKQAAYH